METITLIEPIPGWDCEKVENVYNCVGGWGIDIQVIFIIIIFWVWITIFLIKKYLWYKIAKYFSIGFAWVLILIWITLWKFADNIAPFLYR